MLLGELLVLLQVGLGVFPVFLADLAAALLGNSITSAAPFRLQHSQSHLGHGSKALSAPSLSPCVPVSNGLRSFSGRHAGEIRPRSPSAATGGLGSWGRGRRRSCGSAWSDRGRASVCPIRVTRNLACIKQGACDCAGIKTAHRLLGAATLLHAADMLDAIAALVGFLNIAVNEAVCGDGLAATLANLTVSTPTAHLALNLGVSLGLNLATTLKLAAANGAHACLYIGVQRLRSSPVRRVNLLLSGSNHTADLRIHRGLGLLAVFHV